MISKFRVDELVTNLYIHGVEYTAKRLKPRQIQEWGSNRLQRAAPRKRERERERAILRMYVVVVVVLAVDDDDTTMSLLCICFVYL